MNQEIKEKWIGALRSGHFRQAREQLRGNDGRSYGCLGVLCELYRREEGGVWKLSTKKESWSFLGDVGKLPHAVKVWAGLDCCDPGLGYDSAAGYNDNGSSFEDIADMIEAQL